MTFSYKSTLTATSLLEIRIRLNRLNVEYTFSRGYAKNPKMLLPAHSKIANCLLTLERAILRRVSVANLNRCFPAL